MNCRYFFVGIPIIFCFNNFAYGNQVGGELEDSAKIGKDSLAKFKLSGDVIVGAEEYESFFDADGEDSNSNFFLRRAKLGIDYRLNQSWQYQLDLTVEEKDDEIEFELGDSVVSYNGFKDMSIQLGHIKEPFGFERLTGLNKQVSNERSQVSASFAPGRNYGFSINHTGKKLTWALGYFQEKLEDSPQQAITGRITYAPYLSKEQVVHLGFATSIREYKQSEFQIKQKAELFSADNIIRSARFDAERSRLIGGELFVNQGALGLSAEYMLERVKQSDGTEWNFDGYYLQLSYFITGEQLRYKKGRLKSTKPSKPAGAWQLLARYSETDLRDNNLGSITEVGLLGLNYHWDESLVFKFNYLKPSITGNTLQVDPSGDAVSVRIQYKF